MSPSKRERGVAALLLAIPAALLALWDRLRQFVQWLLEPVDDDYDWDDDPDGRVW